MVFMRSHVEIKVLVWTMRVDSSQSQCATHVCI